MLPESNHASRTSGTRVASSPVSGCLTRTPSINGLCRSWGTGSMASSFNSFVLPTTTVSPPLYVLGDPVDLLVLREKLVEHRCGPPVPGLLRVVEQWCPAPPAVRVGVLEHLHPEQEPLLPQLLEETRIRVLDELPGERPDPLVEGAVGSDRVDSG